jgi:hypothetical protein
MACTRRWTDHAVRCPALGLAPQRIDHEGDQRQHDEDEEQDLRDPGCTGGNAAEAEQRRDQRDGKEDKGLIEHGVLRCAACE